jgi:Na+/H+ antiporter NhaD/arsenite permease-like protein
MSSWLDIPIWAIPLAFSLVMLTHDVLAYHVFQKRKNVPSLSTALRRMTWKIVPFVIGLFIMVEGLNSCGWVDAFASGLSMVSGSLLPSVFLMGFPSDMTLKVSYSPTGEADSIPLGSYKDLP